MPFIKKALLQDDSFKKDCLCSISKQFDVNQVYFWSYQMKL